MEERALYRAILAAPHDDALRLAYADWLDENADALPSPGAERGRAAFIRAQCEAARATPAGWQTPGRGPYLTPRERRLLFHHGAKWRRAFSVRESSAPFDRGFLRPFRVLTAQHFLNLPPTIGAYQPFFPLPPNSPAQRYISAEDGPLAACPLWDVHLYAPGWLNDPSADQGQFGPLLADVARSPGLRQVGWLKLSFLRTPVFDFLRDGDFANVETLVLNNGPFPAVLAAVAGNESFRSLRYVQFGSDRWAWAPSYAELIRFHTLEAKLREANERHLPFGAMRTAVRSVLQNTPLVLPPTPPAVNPWPLTPPPAAHASPILMTAEERQANAVGGMIGSALVVVLAMVYAVASKNSPPISTRITIPEYKPIELKMPEYKPLVVPEFKPFTPYDPLKQQWELDEALRKWQESQPEPPPGTLPPPWLRPKRLPVAPPPRAVEPKTAPNAASSDLPP